MKKCVFLVSALLSVLLWGACSNNAKNGSDSVYDNAEPINISDIISMYEEVKDSENYDKIYDRLYIYNDTVEYKEFSDTDFALSLPKYDKSDNKFLADAEWYYNACAFTFNLWSNFEMWYRDLDNGNIISGSSAMDSKCIRNDSVRADTEAYKEQLLNIMKNGKSGSEESIIEANELLRNMGISIMGHIHKIADEKVLLDSIDSIYKKMHERTKDVLEKYLNMPEEDNLAFMLKAINDCKSFDDQCSLLFNWADCEESRDQNDWIIAVSERLLDSGKYNPRIKELWVLWRAMKQSEWYGSSRDSNIPNQMFNMVRKKCYLTILDRIERYPDDIIAITNATNIGGRFNMLRYGRFYYGNDSSIEEAELLPRRYAKIFGGNDESKTDREDDMTDESSAEE